LARILVVEDDLIVATHLKEILTKNGHVVTGIARSGQDALESVKIQTPDLILMDVLLQDNITGIEVALLLENFLGKSVRVIYLTALPLQNFPEFRGKINDCTFINKPFAEEEVIACIEKLLAKRKKSSR